MIKNTKAHCLPLDIWLYFVLASYETSFGVLWMNKRKRNPDGKKKKKEKPLLFLTWFTENAKISNYIGS